MLEEVKNTQTHKLLCSYVINYSFSFWGRKISAHWHARVTALFVFTSGKVFNLITGICKTILVQKTVNDFDMQGIRNIFGNF